MSTDIEAQWSCFVKDLDKALAANKNKASELYTLAPYAGGCEGGYITLDGNFNIKMLQELLDTLKFHFGPGI